MSASELYGKPPGVSDDQARRTIEFCCALTVVNGFECFDMESVANINVDAVTDALRWLEERGDATEGFRVVRDLNTPHLIRFEVRP